MLQGPGAAGGRGREEGGRPSSKASAPEGWGAHTPAKKRPQTTTSLGHGRQNHGDRPAEPRAGPGVTGTGQDAGESMALPPLALSVPHLEMAQ